MYVDLREVHSFPTRRSSDLQASPSRGCSPAPCWWSASRAAASSASRESRSASPTRPTSTPSLRSTPRSEEHTSELQSRLHLVCRLLPEKKKSTKLSSLQYM